MAAARLRLIILGAPGSGKGTLSSRVVKEFRLSHVSTGDVIRAAINNKNNELGAQMKSLVSKGALVPDELINKIVVNELNKVNSSPSGWLLDGFPRTLEQAKFLDGKQSLYAIDRVLNLNVPFKEIINRLKNRWIHPPSGRVYNLEFNPPKNPGRDDVTGDPLIQREDDKEDIVLKRLKVYESTTKPIIDYYESKRKVATFTGNTSDYLWPLIKEDLHSFRNQLGSQLEKSGGSGEMTTIEEVTHTGQKYDETDYRRARFEAVTKKLVNKNVAMEMVNKEPIVVANMRSVWSSGGGPLGHPKIYLNLDRDEVHVCGYSGRKFIQKKFYDQSKHGKAIDYEQYAEELRRFEQIHH